MSRPPPGRPRQAEGTQRPPLRERPTPAQIAALPPYAQLTADRIHVLQTPEQVAFAERELRAAGHVGFDTESKPIFVAGTPQTGPHVLQFATEHHAFIVQPARPGMADFLRAMIESDDVVKVGFGLASDKPQIRNSLGLELGKCIDLSFLVRRLGFDQPVGLKVAVAVVLGRRFIKSKAATTSNWANPVLNALQLQYAANDAHASLMIHRAMTAAPTYRPEG
jgi:ribonuclease D